MAHPHYYNEIDKDAAQWLRNLIAAGHLPAGDVDERSIEDVTPDDLLPYTQCHFFAGIGGWPLALRQAGWPTDRPVWTGSCPCQPFSAAGKGAGFADERHLWPAWYWLIGERRPPTVFGEQVASKAVDDWIDLVQSDLEALGYAFGSVPFPAAGIGAPHIRDRNYWVAHTLRQQRSGSTPYSDVPRGRNEKPAETARFRGDSRLAHADSICAGERGVAGSTQGERIQLRAVADGCSVLGGLDDDDDDARLEGLRSGHQAALGQRQGPVRPTASASELGGVAYPSQFRECSNEPGPDSGARLKLARAEQRRHCSHNGPDADQEPMPGPLHGFWADADWLLCRDGKWRPVEPGTFPLVDGVPARVVRLRAYGNAIVIPQAASFVRSFMDGR